MSYLRAYGVAVVSILAGASFVHQIYKPDLVHYSLNLSQLIVHM